MYHQYAKGVSLVTPVSRASILNLKIYLRSLLSFQVLHSTHNTPFTLLSLSFVCHNSLIFIAALILTKIIKNHTTKMVSNMNYFSFFAATLGLLFTVVHAQNATVITTNTAGVSYEAILPNSATTNIRGSVVAQSGANDTGVLFQVNFDGFPSEGGPFLYHIHNNRITDGNCSTAGSHLDPFARGETPSCDSTYPATCQVGDLSGKHGKINDTSFSAKFVQPLASYCWIVTDIYKQLCR